MEQPSLALHRRRLTTDEIEEVVQHILADDSKITIPKEIHESIMERQRILLRNQLATLDIHPHALDRVKRVLRRKYMESRISPGESVGILCAQSIGERQTQMTLNTFHAAGMTVQTVITGVPRFLELLNASKEPKISSTRCFLKTQYDDVHLLKQELSPKMIETYLTDLYTKYEVLENQPSNHGFWYSTYGHVYGKYDKARYALLTKGSHFIRYEMSKDALYRFDLHMFKIMHRLYELYEDILCIISPNHVGILDVFVDPEHIVLPTEEEILCGEAEEGAVEGLGGEEEESVDGKNVRMNFDRFRFLTEENKFLVYLEDVVVPNLQSHRLFGIPNVKDYFIERLASCNNEYILHTQGNNYSKLLTCPWIDASRTISNNMWNIYECLGIEATREFLIQEFTQIVSSDGTFINDCHIALLVDIMTFSGTIISISRYGMKNDQFGALAKASFEESLDNFLKAGFFSERETTKDVSASIICGKRPNIGTGLCDVLLDMDKML